MARFRFASRWTVSSDASTLFDVLADVEGYAAWWPQVRRMRRLSPDSGEVTIRSALPWNLHLVLTREVEDAAAGVLRVRLDGDLVGWSQWTVRDGVADYAQECDVTSPLLGSLPRAVDPVLRANHAHMMRRGEQGLRHWLTAVGDRPT